MNNEPTYCFCKRAAVGPMIACDNPDCPLEWFHFECVGLLDSPDGYWLCPDCEKLAYKGELIE